MKLMTLIVVMLPASLFITLVCAIFFLRPVVVNTLSFFHFLLHLLVYIIQGDSGRENAQKVNSKLV